MRDSGTMPPRSSSPERLGTGIQSSSHRFGWAQGANRFPVVIENVSLAPAPRERDGDRCVRSGFRPRPAGPSSASVCPTGRMICEKSLT